MLLKYLKNIALAYCVAVPMETKHGSYLVTMTCIIIIFIDALSFLAFVVQSIVVGGNNSGDASWLLSMGE